LTVLGVKVRVYPIEGTVGIFNAHAVLNFSAVRQLRQRRRRISVLLLID